MVRAVVVLRDGPTPLPRAGARAAGARKRTPRPTSTPVLDFVHELPKTASGKVGERSGVADVRPRAPCRGVADLRRSREYPRLPVLNFHVGQQRVVDERPEQLGDRGGGHALAGSEGKGGVGDRQAHENTPRAAPRRGGRPGASARGIAAQRRAAAPSTRCPPWVVTNGSTPGVAERGADQRLAPAAVRNSPKAW